MPSPPAMAAAMKATRTTSGSTPSRSPSPAQTPPRTRRPGSRRNGGEAALVVMLASMLGPPAQPERDEGRPHRRQGDGGEAPEAQVDRVDLVQEERGPERDEGDPPDERGEVGPTHGGSPR